MAGRNSNNGGRHARQCRLCGLRDGPFVNIFGEDMGLADKIRKLLPVLIEERDDHPHKVCFRCSAKVTDLYDFAQMCVRTQNALFKSSGVRRARDMWEEKLKEKKLSNDEYCESVVRKAIESFETAVPLKPLTVQLSRIDSVATVNKPKTPQSKPEPKPKPQPAEELCDNISFLDVTGLDSIYTCKICHRIFTQKDGITSHECKKIEKKSQETAKKSQPDPSVPYPVSLLCRNTKAQQQNAPEPPSSDKEYKIVRTKESSKLIITSVKRKGTSEGSEGRSSKSSKSSSSTSKTIIDGREPFFTIYNVESGSSSSPIYVLPTRNTIQESAISTTKSERSAGRSTASGVTKIISKYEPFDKNKAMLSCDYCDKFFHGERALRMHTRIHL